MAAKKKTSTTKAARKVAALMKKPETAVMLAFSNSAEVDEGEFFDCVEAGFARVGKKNLKPETNIVWASFSVPQVRKIGNAIEKCLDGKGLDCPPLDDSFKVLHDEKRTMFVSDLVQALIDLTD